MRAIVCLAVFLLAACSDHEARQSPARDAAAPLTGGEERHRIDHARGAAIVMRSGPNVPVHLPKGFTVYPGGRTVANTVVERDGRQTSLLVFETGDPIAKIIAHYRAQVQATGATVSLDLASEEHASLGGMLAGGGHFTLAMRRHAGRTRVEFASG